MGHLLEVTADLAAARNRTQREIDLLHEYRTRLIADVVTGKLDVRQAAARLPDDAEGREAADDADSLPDTEAALDDPDTVAEEDAA